METYIKNIPENFWNIRFLDKYMANHKGFIAGGSFKNIFLKEQIKDIDIFFEKSEYFDKAQEYFTSKEAQEDGWYVRYENSKVFAVQKKGEKLYIEFVHSIFGLPEEILRKFDFTITKFAYFKETLLDSDGTEKIEYKLLYHKDFFEHLTTKRLVLDENIPFPISTWERSYRYKGYGFNMCRESKVKLLDALRKSNDNEENISMYNIGGWD